MWVLLLFILSCKCLLVFSFLKTRPPLLQISSLRQRSITGVDIVNCRSFSINELKDFSFIGSFSGLNSMPVSFVPEISFVGRSNVGKSSLLNVLTGQRKKVAVEGNTPGTTKLINLFECSDQSGPVCRFVDLPGYGFARLSQDKQSEISSFLRDYLLARRSLKVVVMLLDSRREPTRGDLEMLQLILESGVRVVVVATKADKLSKGEAVELPKRVRNWLSPILEAAYAIEEANERDSTDRWPVVPFSATTGQGRAQLWNAIRHNILADE